MSERAKATKALIATTSCYGFLFPDGTKTGFFRCAYANHACGRAQATGLFSSDFRLLRSIYSPSAMKSVRPALVMPSPAYMKIVNRHGLATQIEITQSAAWERANGIS